MPMALIITIPPHGSAFRQVRLVALMASLIAGGFADLPAADLKLSILEETAFKEAAARVDPSIVQIQTVGGLDRVGKVLTGTAPTTGVVVSEDGYVISSAFNFASKPASILVRLADGRQFSADLVATDRLRMVTLLKIEVKGLTVPVAAPKADFQVGQWSIAMGRTYDFKTPSLGVGIVSALDRIWGKAIQTDAKVSPINYGGPLVDIQGRVMGVLVPMSPRGNTEIAGVEWYDGGIGFAIPLVDIQATLDRMKAGVELKPGLMGVDLEGRDIYADKPVVSRVRAESPAEQAGLKKGDLFTEIDGKKVVNQSQIKQVLGAKYAGDSVKVVVSREGKSIPAELKLVDKLVAFEAGFLGILPDRLATADEKGGVVVRYIYAKSPAETAGLKVGDRITKFNDATELSIDKLTDIVARVDPGDPASLTFEREGKASTVNVKLASVPDAVPATLSSVAITPGEKKDDGPKVGRFSRKIPGHDNEFWAYVPEDYNPDHEYGLMVWLHPNSDTMEATIIKNWRPICDLRGLIVLAPKAEKLGGWTLSESQAITDSIKKFQEDYSIDDRRIFLHAYSSGGTMAYHTAFKERELIRGLAIVSSALRTQPPDNTPLYRMQILLNCGDKDDAFRTVQATAAGLKRLKFPITNMIGKGRAHAYAPANELDEIARWVDSLDRI
ncbi:MAG: PDZ domain-containing protein [Planctomycetota bacterium]|nr:PDZ domain-containing protein [Planctomycetota bacterium]